MESIARWWDGVELWLAQLPFFLQFPLVMAVLLPAALGVARFIDRVVDEASARLSGDPEAEPPVGALPTDVREPRLREGRTRS
ncbi:hypothetical protein KCV87_14310 [Actinosynnema pretiosum subsp. pretiosum]|uniref:Uncharacterized protein n=3 Tax=Actinosynnema TaxID=40566 RepID=C6WRC6_ACTMD|nr:MULTISPECIES: hypothetical protein [Actinosynnema]ACU35178.1 hypothetical protein Amir_1226 [Actinosynnema mirum DSM 43827]ATE52908.1 hypothetical protein CNX65_06125 [Actinosynnema pretiosum]QUF07106.1 hypothetical protein KCV87_14310 [Actinosynnema pretiosum subsp. pretiosum]